MTAGFLAYAVGVGAMAYELERRGSRPVAAALAVNVAATVAIAALPLGRLVTDRAHAAAAAAAYSALAAAPLIAARAEAGASGVPARWSRATGVAVAAALTASATAPQTGLFQRLGLTLGDVWIGATALAALRRPGGP